MPVAILSLGTEIVRGELVNHNAQWLAEAISDDGLEVSELACVADDKQAIMDALARLGQQNVAIVSTGGLGPTSDDLTTEAVAELLREPLLLEARALEAIRERFARTGRSMAPSNEKQAWLPRSAKVLDNDCGTAPGFAVNIGGARAYFLPGVPLEMQRMFERHVRAELRQGQSEHIHQIRLNTFGMPESSVNDELSGLEQEFGVQLGYRAHFPEVQVKVLARAADQAQAVTMASLAANEVRRRLGPRRVFSEGEVPLAQAVADLLKEQGRMLGLAESCTGGLVAQLITERPGASEVFAGGVVSYANQVKHTVLGVPLELLEMHGAVSQPVAEAMARGACRTLGVGLGLALTGIAGPSGGSEHKPVGLVHIALADGSRLLHERSIFPGTRRQIQWRAAFAALQMLRIALLALPNSD